VTPRAWAIAAVVLVLTAVGAFSAGRFSAPQQVQTRIEYRDLSVEDLTRGLSFVKTVNRTVYRNVTTTATDAGVITVDRTIEHEGTDEKRDENTVAHRATENVGTETRTVTLRPDWRISAQVGASMHAPALPITGPLVLGVSVERRIVGGVSAGLWANTVGAGGASLSVEF
jgi:hypothetical protein